MNTVNIFKLNIVVKEGKSTWLNTSAQTDKYIHEGKENVVRNTQAAVHTHTQHDSRYKTEEVSMKLHAVRTRF